MSSARTLFIAAKQIITPLRLLGSALVGAVTIATGWFACQSNELQRAAIAPVLEPVGWDFRHMDNNRYQLALRELRNMGAGPARRIYGVASWRDIPPTVPESRPRLQYFGGDDLVPSGVSTHVNFGALITFPSPALSDCPRAHITAQISYQDASGNWWTDVYELFGQPDVPGCRNVHYPQGMHLARGLFAAGPALHREGRHQEP